MASSGQRASKEHSGGMRIDDHKFFAGGMDKETVMPRGAHFKGETTDGSAGSLMNYEDTTEKIREQQEMGVRKQKSHNRRELYRY